jgi:putative endonuclease
MATLRSNRSVILLAFHTMFYVYVLLSETTGRYYTGHTANLIERPQQHNAGMSQSTRAGAPWRTVHHEAFSTRSAATQRERFLKTGRGREELKKLLEEASWSAEATKTRQEQL